MHVTQFHEAARVVEVIGVTSLSVAALAGFLTVCQTITRRGISADNSSEIYQVEDDSDSMKVIRAAESMQLHDLY